MKLAVPTETRAGEHRVALIPDVAGRLAGTGVEVVVQEGAGVDAHFPDAAYVENLLLAERRRRELPMPTLPSPRRRELIEEIELEPVDPAVYDRFLKLPPEDSHDTT